MAKQKKGEAGEAKSGSSQPRLPLLWFPRFGRSVKEINEVQKRRKLATERFSDDGETGRKVVSFVNSRGQTLFSQSWTRVQELRYGPSFLTLYSFLLLCVPFKLYVLQVVCHFRSW